MQTLSASFSEVPEGLLKAWVDPCHEVGWHNGRDQGGTTAHLPQQEPGLGTDGPNNGHQRLPLPTLSQGIRGSRKVPWQWEEQ